MKKLKTIKMYLPTSTVDFICKNDCELASAQDTEEYEFFEKVLEQLQFRDSDNKFSLTEDVFQFIIGCLSWYCDEYWNRISNEEIFQ